MAILPQLGGVPETDARWFFQQFIIAVDYCHRLGIANRDIKVRCVAPLSYSAACVTREAAGGWRAAPPCGHDMAASFLPALIGCDALGTGSFGGC